MDGSKGTIISGPTYTTKDGLNFKWWEVYWDDGYQGWSAEYYPGGVYYLVLASTGRFGITTDPSGVRVYIGGSYKGLTPLKVDVNPGSYSIKLEKDGYETRYVTTSVSAGELKLVQETLPKNTVSSPSVSTSSATSISSSSATLNGALTSMEGASSCTVYFQYGTSKAYGSTTGTQTKGSTGTFSQSITGLSPGTTYHYRAVASNSAGTVYGADTTFMTHNDRVFGIDVSHWQGDINWNSVHNSGNSFAFVKATEGDGLTDSRFITNMNGASANGMLVGAYHFARPDLGNSATDEANYFVEVAGDYISQGYLRPVLDLEYGASLGKEALSDWVETWASTVRSKTGVSPIIYVNSNYAKNYLNQDISQNDLWIAHWTYDPSLNPSTGIWTNWVFWQYSNNGRVSGIEGDVDLDVFNGDLSSLRNYIISLTPNSDQPTFKAPWEGSARITQGTNGATSHYDHGTWDNTYGLDIASMTAGETFDVLAPYDGTVCYIDNDEAGAGGKEVAICHTYGGNKYVTVYLHLSEILVANGTSLKQGEKFAVSGMTGSATGVHLHFHMYKAPGSYDSHTQPIKRIILKKTGIDSDFKEYDQTKGELDDSVISKYNDRVFESNNIQILPITSPSVSTSSATSVSSSSATLNGALTSMGGAFACTVYFQYGATASYGSTTGTQTKSSNGAFSQSITGLSPGTTYHYRAVASNSAGTVYGADTAFSTETAPTLPTANFTANVTSGIAPLAVRFTDTSTGDPTSWSWTFGDGATSTEQHLVHTYTVSGTYTVSLTVMNSAGSDTMIRAGYIKVSPQQNILWEVPLSVASGTLSQTVTLGSAESATREFDAWLDVPMPPDAPGAKKSVYFTCPDPTFGELSADYRPPVDDANPEESWTLCIRSDEPVQVTWNTTTLSKSELFLTWNNGTNSIAMKATSGTTLPAGSYSISISASTVQQMDLPLQVGWNLVSVPFNDAAYTVPQNSVLAIYGYNPSTKGYETVSRIESLVPGKAYWIASGRDCTVTVTGTPVSPVTAQLKQGWNLIGSAAGQSTFDSIAMTPAGSWAMPFVYGYDPQTKGYVQITELQPGKGYWGAVTRDCTITLS